MEFSRPVQACNGIALPFTYNRYRPLISITRYNYMLKQYQRSISKISVCGCQLRSHIQTSAMLSAVISNTAPYILCITLTLKTLN